MKVTVKSNNNLNRRVGLPSVNAKKADPPLPPGTEIITDGKLYKGDPYQGIDLWVRDAANNYYWSGGVTFSPAHAAAGTTQITFPWFEHLKIADIWQKYGTRGEGVKVAVLDSGYAKIPDLKPLAEKVCIDKNIYPGITINDEDKSYSRYHGTRCASLIGAKNNRDWIVGIAPESDLLIGKITQYGNIQYFDYIIEGIKWAIDQGAEVISISYSKRFDTATDTSNYYNQLSSIVSNKNILIFVSASGDDDMAAFPNYFADLVTIIGASTLLNEATYATRKTSKATLCILGENIESFNGITAPTPLSGSSLSTAITSGIAVLAISHLKKTTGTWDKAAVLNAISNTAIPAVNAPHKKIIDPLKFFNHFNQPIV